MVLSHVLRQIAWRIRVLIAGVFILCLILFISLGYYATTLKRVSADIQKRSRIEHFSVHEELTQYIKNFRFTTARKNFLKDREILLEVSGGSSLEKKLIKAQEFAKYDQLLDVINQKISRFIRYVKGRKYTSIEKQLLSLSKKIEIEKKSLKRHGNFDKYIEGIFEKIKRIAQNKKFPSLRIDQLEKYIEDQKKELELLKKSIEVKEVTEREALKFESSFKAHLSELKKKIYIYQELLQLFEFSGVILALACLLGILGLLVFSFLKKNGLFKKLHQEVEQWLLDYTRSLFQKKSFEIPRGSDDFHKALRGMIEKYGQLQTVGELIENRLPFVAMLTDCSGRIIWHNKALNTLSELSRERLSDIWLLKDELTLRDGEFEGICTLKNNPKMKFEYLAIPLKRHQKYFIIFSPLERVKNHSQKELRQRLDPIEEALDGILLNSYQPKNHERKNYSSDIQNILETISSLNALIVSERKDYEKRLGEILKEAQDKDLVLSEYELDTSEIRKTLHSYRKGIEGIRKCYLDMVTKQDEMAQIFTESLRRDKETGGIASQLISLQGGFLESLKKNVFKLDEVLEKPDETLSHITLSKVKMYLDEISKNMEAANSHYTEYKGLFSSLHKQSFEREYQSLTEEISEVDKGFIQLISKLYEDIAHITYRLEGASQEKNRE